MGGQSGSGKTTTTNEIPAELKGLTSKTAGKVGALQDQPGFNPGDYIAPHPLQVPGLTGNQQQAIGAAPSIGQTTPGEYGAYGALGGANLAAGQSGLATGADFANDPSIAAAYNAYKTQVQPGLENQYGLMGLGKSTSLGDAAARGAASQLFPATQAALEREQSANENRIGRQTSTALSSAGQLANLGSQDTQRRLAGLNALLTTGQTERGVQSEDAAAKQQDFLRQQAMAEQGTYGVLGQLPSSFGSQVASKTSGGGMFK